MLSMFRYVKLNPKTGSTVELVPTLYENSFDPVNVVLGYTDVLL